MLTARCFPSSTLVHYRLAFLIGILLACPAAIADPVPIEFGPLATGSLHPSSEVDASAGLTTRLEAWWPFEGDCADESGNGNHGTVHGATLMANRFGHSDSAYEFDGVNDYVDIGKGVKPSLPITVSSWVKIANGGLVFRNDAYDDGSYRYGVALHCDGGYLSGYIFEGFSAPSNRRNKNSYDAVVTQGAWHHVAAVFRSIHDIRLYCDGIEVAGSSHGEGSGLRYSPSGHGALGLYYTNTGGPRSRYFDGSMDDLMVYAGALSDEEILELFAPGADEDWRYVASVYPSSVTNSARVPVHILAWGLEPNMQVELKSDGTSIAAEKVVLSSPRMLIAQFDLSAAPLGAYDVSVIWPDGGSLDVQDGVTVRQLPAGALYEYELSLGRGQVWSESIVLPQARDDLFVTLQKSTLVAYGDSWSSTLALTRDGEEIVARSGSHDLLLQAMQPEAGTYELEVTAHRAGKGTLTVWDRLPELPIDQWVVSQVHCSYGSTWHQVEVLPGQDTLRFEAEAIGLWSHFDVFHEEYNGGTRWTSRQGPRVTFEISNPPPGTYIVEFLDSAMIQGDGGYAQDQSRDVLLRASTTDTSEPPPTYLPTITGLSTDRGGNTGMVTVEITGAWLDPNAIVSLTHPDHNDIVARTVSGDTGGSTLTATFDLTDKEPNQYTLLVTNPNGHTIAAPAPFTIEQGGEPNLWVEIVGRDEIRVGRWATFLLRYGNSGNVNATYPYVALTLQKVFECEIESEFFTIPPGDKVFIPGDAEPFHVTVLGLPELAPATVREVALRVKSNEIAEGALSAAITMDEAAVYASMFAFGRALYLDLVGPEVEGLSDPLRIPDDIAMASAFDFPDKDTSNTPPADSIMFWSHRGEWHSAKSLGNGDFIEIMPDGDDNNPDVNIKNLRDNPYPGWDYWGAYRLPGEPISEEELRARVDRLREEYGIDPDDPHNRSEYTGRYCDSRFLDDGLLRTYCFGLVFALNYDKIYMENGWLSEQKVYDHIRLPSDPTWQERMNNIGMRWDSDAVSQEDANCFPIFKDGLEKFFRSVGSATPEDKFGPTGYDLPDTAASICKRFVRGDRDHYYRVDFWNKEDATASAYDVLVEDRLDGDLDWGSFRFEDVGFRKWNVELEPCQYFNVDIDMRPEEDWIVNGEGTFDTETGIVTWWFRTLDPATRQTPEDPLAGFLPPITDSGEEVGWVGYTVRPQADLATGTQIANQAFVEFDHAGDLYEHPAPKEGPWINTIDAGAPASNVLPLPEITRAGEFAVEWSGQDDENGSGIVSYDIYVSTDGEPYQLWLDDVNETSAVFNAADGTHTYAFYSVARDGVGHVEAAPSAADATTLAGVEGCCLTVSVTGAGATKPDAGDHCYTCGSEVDVQAFADPGHSFLRWEGTAKDAGKIRLWHEYGDAKVTVMLDADYTLEAVFE